LFVFFFVCLFVWAWGYWLMFLFAFPGFCQFLRFVCDFSVWYRIWSDFSRFLILCSICCVKVPLELQQNPRRSILFLNRQYVRSCLKEGSIKTWSTSW
jgi:hypothetical protein